MEQQGAYAQETSPLLVPQVNQESCSTFESSEANISVDDRSSPASIDAKRQDETVATEDEPHTQPRLSALRASSSSNNAIDPKPSGDVEDICRKISGQSTRNEDVWDAVKFWAGSIAEPYAAPDFGYSRVLGREITSIRARADARTLRLMKGSMELTLDRIEQFSLETVPENDTFFDVLLQGKLRKDLIPEMEARQAICQRHITLFEMINRQFINYNITIKFRKEAKEIRNYLSHAYGFPGHESSHDEKTVYAKLVQNYRKALVGIDQVLEALEKALGDASRWSSSPPPNMVYKNGRGNPSGPTKRVQPTQRLLEMDLPAEGSRGVDDQNHTDDEGNTIDNERNPAGAPYEDDYRPSIRTRASRSLCFCIFKNRFYR